MLTAISFTTRYHALVRHLTQSLRRHVHSTGVSRFSAFRIVRWMLASGPFGALWSKLYYQQQRGRGKDHHAAVRALAYKWIRIMFRCWKDRTPYVDSVYVKSLTKRGSHLARRLNHPDSVVEMLSTVCESRG
jgi:hypothetical protein